MVPEPTRTYMQTGRFPRASGDGPNVPTWQGKLDVFPPRERGWSLTWSGEQVEQRVSPARAGMVPVATPQFHTG